MYWSPERLFKVSCRSRIFGPSGDVAVLYCVSWVITVYILLRQLFWLALLDIFKIFNMFLAFFSYCYCKICFMSWRVYKKSYDWKKFWYTLLDFCEITVPLAFIFVILDFKGCFFICCKVNIIGGISTKGVFYGSMFIVGIFMGEKIPRQFSRRYFLGGSFIKSSKSLSNSATLST